MTRIVGTFQLAEALKAEGFPLPDECGEARLVMGVHKAFVIQYDVFLTGENLAKLGRALQRAATPDAAPAPPSPLRSPPPSVEHR